MRKLKVIEYVTLDGVIEDPGPAGDFKYRGWTVPFWNDEMAAAQSKELFASDVLLFGPSHIRGVRSSVAPQIRRRIHRQNEQHEETCGFP
jgi:hypothetical protein